MRTFPFWLSSFFLWHLLSLLLVFHASAGNHPNIMVLHSYHTGFTWTDGIDAAIRKQLRLSIETEIISEYLDSKRWPLEQVSEPFFHYLKNKYQDQRLSVIIVSDNNALTFLHRYYTQLFPGVPVVFCGINNYQPSLLEGFANRITGVIEKTDPAGTVRLIQRLQPDLKRLMIITGITPTAQAIRKEALTSLAPFETSLELVWLDSFETSQLAQQVQTCGKRDAILLIAFNRDRNGTYYAYEESGRMISKWSRAPVYGMWDFYLNTGVLGGSMVSSHDQGKTAADLCLQILKTGQMPPVVITSPNSVMVDCRVISKYDIDDLRIPADTILLNKPFSFYQTYKKTIWSVFSAMALLLLLVIALSLNIAARRKSERKYREIFNASSDAIFIHDARTGAIVDVNEPMLNMYGIDRKTALQSTVEDFSSGEPPYNIDGANRKIRLAFEKGPQTFYWHAKRKDGQLFWVEVNLIASKIGDKRRVMAVARDITERFKTQEMIIQSEKMLSVGGLAAGMAHEINNPLAGMMQSANIIENRLRSGQRLAASEKAAEKAGTTMDAIEHFMEARDIFRLITSIRDSGSRVAAIVDNMLSFARKREAVFTMQDPAALMDNNVELASTDYDLKNSFDFKRIKIIKEYEADLPQIPCEGSKIQQVIFNILKNGAQAMLANSNPGNGLPPTFILRLKTDRSKDRLIIEIEDSGPGMDAKTRKRIFEPFFTTKPVGVGTGLGLSVSYFIIKENHHGDMRVKSTPGQGATFIIELPLKASPH